MSCSRSANRRLLSSILYASSHQPSLARSVPLHLPVRSLTTSGSRNSPASTFSFGPQGDSVIAELASKESQNDDSTGVAATKPRGRKTKPLRQKEATTTEHHDTVDVGSSTDAPIPTPPTTLRHQNPDEVVIDTAAPAPVRSQPPQFPTPTALDEALTAHFREKARLPDGATKQQRNSSREKRVDRTPPSQKTKQDKIPANKKKARDSASSPSPRGNTGTLSYSEITPKLPTESKPQRRPELVADPDRKPANNKNLPAWAIQKAALKAKFGSEGWNPRRKLSPDAMLGIRNMHLSDPLTYTTPILAKQFKVSAEAIRRILKSKWLANAGAERMQARRERWAKRHDDIWDQQAALGLRPARKAERRVRDAAEGADEVEHELWAEETLEKARAENPLFK